MPSIYYKNYKPDPAGTLSCGGSTQNSITLSYTYTNATTDLRIYNNQSQVHIINIDENGSGEGTYTVGGLASGTSYTYKLIHGNNVNEQVLAEAECATQAVYSGGGGGGGWSGIGQYWIYVDSTSSSISFETSGGNPIITYYGNDSSYSATITSTSSGWYSTIHTVNSSGPGWVSVWGPRPTGVNVLGWEGW